MFLGVDLGISVGVGLTTRWLLSLFTPDTVNEGPRVEDLKSPSSEYGKGIPKVYGISRIGGNLMWARDVIEVKNEDVEGGKGGPTVTNITYTYFGTFAVLICEGPVTVTKIWLSSKLVYSTSGGAETISASNKFVTEYLTIYDGTPSQSPNSAIQSIEGINRTPAFRGLCYLVFNNLPLADYSNTFPLISVEVQSQESNDLGYIVNQICLKSGLQQTEIDVSELVGKPVTGLMIPQNGESHRSIIEQLQQVFFFYFCEDNGILRFRSLVRNSAINVNFVELGSVENDSEKTESYNETQRSFLEIPSEISVDYYNPNLNFDRDKAVSINSSRLNENKKSIDTQLVLTRSEGLTACTRLLYQLWINRKKFEFTLPPKYIGSFLVGDLINLPIRNGSQPIQIQELNIGNNNLIQVRGVVYEGTNLSAIINIPENPRIDDEIPDPVFLGNLNFYPKDIPLIDDNDTEEGIYTLLEAPTNSYKNGLVYYSKNNISYAYASLFTGESTIGNCNNILGSARGDLIDYKNTLTVTLDSGTLESITDSEFYELKNIALVGNELIAFKNAVLVSTNTYNLSTFIRGLKGTEHKINSHIASEKFFLMKGTGSITQRFTANSDLLGTTINFKAIVPNQPLNSATAVPLLVTGEALRPYSPSHAKGERDIDGNITISWIRRSRKTGEWRDYSDVPLNESYEAYDIEIMSGLTVKRTLSATTQTVGYSASQQITDFGSLQNSVVVQIYQISDIVGRGNPLIATI